MQATALRGDASGMGHEPWGAFVQPLRADARRSGMKEVRLDVRALGFISSSCFKPLVTWLAALRERADEERHENATHTQP